jgi:hypothetical protein
MGGEGGDTGPVKLSRLAAAGGVAGWVLFTVAWVVSWLRQAGHRTAGVQLSGLAVEDAPGSAGSRFTDRRHACSELRNMPWV